MTELRYTGAGFNHPATGELDTGDTADVEDEGLVEHFVENYQFERVEQQESAAAEAETESGAEPLTDLEDLEGVGDATAQNLRTNGYGSLDDVREADAEELVARTGLNAALVEAIKDQLE